MFRVILSENGNIGSAYSTEDAGITCNKCM